MREFVRGTVSQAAVRTLCIVAMTPLFSDGSRFQNRAESLHIQACVPEFAVETFARNVLPRACRIYVMGLHAFPGKPLFDLLDNKLPAIITADEVRRAAATLRFLPAEGLYQTFELLSSS